MATTFKILPQLDEKNRARLESKTYTSAYTNIPNRVLPENYSKGLSAVFKALTGEDFDLEAHTFTVRADANGVFQRLYSPTLFSNEDGTGLLIRWGDTDIPVVTSPGKIGVASALKGTKFSFKDEQIGKYTEPVLSVSVPSEGTIYTLPIPIRKREIKEEMSADILDLMLDENHQSICEKVYIAPDPSKRSENASYEKMVGPYIKVSSLPKGDYKVTTYRKKDGGQYGTDYYMQIQVSEPFSAPVRTQVDGVWTSVDTEITDWAIVRPNTSLKKTLSADPLISSESPATLSILEHFEFNGNPAVEAKLKCSNFVKDVDSFDLDF